MDEEEVNNDAVPSELAFLGVRARRADLLEQEVCDQLEEAMAGGEREEEEDEGEGPSTAVSLAHRTKGIDGLLGLDSSIKHGEVTPFELQRLQEQRTNASSDLSTHEVKQESGDDYEEELRRPNSAAPFREVKQEAESSEEEDEVERKGKRKHAEKRRQGENEGVNGAAKRQRIKEEEERESDDEYVPSDGGVEEEGEEEDEEGEWIDTPSTSKGRRPKKEKEQKKDKYKDDGDDAAYEKRIRRYQAEREMKKLERDEEEESDEEEYKTIHDNLKVDALKVDARVWAKLYKYQKTGVRWLAELHDQRVGGILADEMGLGKTIQTTVFLRAMAESQRDETATGFTGLGPSLLICPATLLQQWVREVHQWFPLCRIAVLHSCGSHRGAAKGLIAKMAVERRNGSILVTSYTTFFKHRKALCERRWHYAILDEGHKIRNPEARISLAIKELHSQHRIILSGSPMQNSLRELWSLVDFVFPGRLGSLKTFKEKFAIPITIGGYANATEIQTETAYKCAIILRDAINPYFLRRMKKDVQMALELPPKSEQILFCDLVPEQRKLYLEYLGSRECRLIQSGRLEAFAGLILLRKICNHPDLVTGGPNKYGYEDESANAEMAFGWPMRSGKAQVVRSLLQLWRGKNEKRGETVAGPRNKVLLFSQSRRMLTVLEQMLIIDGHSYLRMDGGTAIAKRQNLVAQFNEDPSMFVFLLTTRVGGVGVNLTGANKVVIFDPDWNPSTDAQARERAWRIGQKRDVTVYRLIATGTIEEKMYHRQIFKQFLANRVLKDPKQRRFFKTNDLHDLFTLTDGTKGGSTTDTGAIFSGQTDEITKDNFFDLHQKERDRQRKEARKKGAAEEEKSSDEEQGEETLSESRRAQLREIAARMSSDLASLQPVKKKRTLEEGEVDDGQRNESLFNKRYSIPYLRKHRKEKKEKVEKKKVDKKSSKNGDDYVLGKLLSQSGVRAALKHDDVVGEGKKKIFTKDSHLVEREAENVAKQAAAAIRSRPKFNFLQRNGYALPSSSVPPTPAFGSGSALRQEEGSGSDLLAIIRARNARSGGASQQPLPANNKWTELAGRVKSFLREQILGAAHSDVIVDKFKKEIGPRDKLQFRSILKEMAIFDGTTKQWTLLHEYR